MPFFHLMYNDGKSQAAKAFKTKLRIPEAGDVLIALKSFYALSGSQYNPGDTFELLERTQDAPFHILNSLGNLRVKCKDRTSVWSNIELAMSEGLLGFKE